jgi:hypothetical protein
LENEPAMPIDQSGKGGLIRVRDETLQKLPVAPGIHSFPHEAEEERGELSCWHGSLQGLSTV